MREGAGETDPLHLAAGQPRVGQLRAVSLRHPPDEIIGARCLRCGGQFRPGGNVLAEGDHIGEGLPDQHRTFEAVPDGATQVASG
jgi:hypothetical protein